MSIATQESIIIVESVSPERIIIVDGAVGPTGPQGPSGPAGANGAPGTQGPPGLNGSGGITLYQWVRYSANPNGYPMTSEPVADTRYLGMAVNMTTITPSNDHTLYVWTLIKGEGGGEGVGVYKEFIYIAAAVQPATPTGNFPAGWSTTPPVSEFDLWMSTGTKTTEGNLSGEWSVPIKFTGGTPATGETNYKDFIYIRSETDPATPTGDMPVGWSVAPPTEPAAFGLWMSTGFKTAAGVLIGVWSTPVKLTGENGTDGIVDEDVVQGAGFYGAQYPNITWDTVTVNARFQTLVGRPPVNLDIFFQTLTTNTNSEGRQYNSASGIWVPVAFTIAGSMIATGTIAGDRLVAGTSLQAPIIKGGRIELIGLSAIKIESATPFGPNNLTRWYGARIDGVNFDTTVQNVIWAGITKASASSWEDSLGNAYFGGSIIAGTLKTAVQNPTFSNSVSVSSGVFGSDGGLIVVKSSFMATNHLITSGDSCSGVALPTATVILKKKISGVWTIVATENFTGTMFCEEESGIRNAGWTVTGSFNYQDTDYNTVGREYELFLTHDVPMSFSAERAQRLSLITEE